MTDIRLILGDQLNADHPWFDTVDPAVVYVMMEVRQETDYVLHHAQKIIAIFAAMRAFADDLRAAGHRLVYLVIDDPDNRQSLTDNLDTLIAQHGATRFQYQLPDEWRLDRQLADYAVSNVFGHDTPLPPWFWTGQTGMACLLRFYRPVVRSGLCPSYPAADGDQQFRAAGGAGPARTASVVSGHLHRCV